MTRRALVAGLALCVGAAPAGAHSPIQGIGNFYNGALHPIVSAPHLLALLALGLMVGQEVQRAAEGDRGRRVEAPFIALLGALALGLAGHRLAGDPDTDLVLLALAVGLGLSVAAAWAPPRGLLLAVTAATGLAVAVASGPSQLEGAARWTHLVGVLGVVMLVCAYVAVLVAAARLAWLRIAVRVVGSWLAAAALLVLALSFAR